MDKYYLEFLDELIFCLERYENSSWTSWMNKSKNKFIQEKDVTYFLEAFGGIGGFNDDRYCEKGDLKEIVDILVNNTYSLAIVIKDNKLTSILDIIKHNYEIYLRNYNNGYDIDSNYKKINYSEYLLSNYELGNLHFITQNYIENLLNNKKIK